MTEKNEIHLPKTNFPMRGNLSKREPELFKKWDEKNLYKKIIEKRKGKIPYILHDGPPYANGNIHMGHVLNKVLKDIVVRYKLFKGFYSPFVPGWDCHGMPIEHKVVENLGEKSKKMSKLEIRKLCKDYALKYVNIQREQFKRLGILGDWENPYLTLDKEYENKMVDIFWALYKKGLIYKGLKPVYWCFSCETALAEAEVEYKEHTTPSIYVKFKIQNIDKSLKKLPLDSYIIIWTTTPWTLPGNVGIAVHPDYEYILTEIKNEKYVLAKELLNNFLEKIGEKDYKIIDTFYGKDIENTTCLHPFIDRESKVILADYVKLDTGTGCVHIAPGHGYEDYMYGIKYNLDILNPVDSKGEFTEEFSELKGENVFDANEKVIDILKNKNALIFKEKITHSYPHCWRCKKPIIFRATKQWFISMEANNFRKQILENIKKVKWLNEWGEERITKMVETRPDWCISRQRVWGVPIFVFYCNDCGNTIVTEQTIERVKILIKNEGSDGWLKHSAKEILGDDFKCPSCGSNNIDKENDIFDVWFDSGSSSFAVLETRDDLKWPADLYLEGSDQYRGWFQSSLITSVGFKGAPPYKSVISTGWVVDGEGRAMHKSLGNVIDPLDLIKKGGSDVLRLWVASEDFKTDQPISDEIMSRITDSYRRIRNTFRFLLGNLYDFKKEDSIPYENLLKLDKYALHKLEEIIKKIDKYYENFEFYKVYKDFTQFASVFLSSFYFDILKDRLYTFKKDGRERRSAQTVLYKILIKLSKIIAPILTFTADEVWQFIPTHLKEEEHIHLTFWDFENEKMLDETALKKWDILLNVRDIILKKQEEARNKGLIKHPYESAVIIKYSSKKLAEILDYFKDEIDQIFIVSQIEYKKENLEEKEWNYNLEIDIVKAKGKKCKRCWRYSETVGQNNEYPEFCERCIKNL